MNNIGTPVHSVKRARATVLYSPTFQLAQAVPINFDVHIFRPARYSQLRTGILTLPTRDLGHHVLL